MRIRFTTAGDLAAMREITRLASESAARDEGFREVELMATLAGEPLYRACGYRQVERTSTTVDHIAVPLVRMRKRL